MNHLLPCPADHLLPLSSRNLPGALFFSFANALSISAGFIFTCSSGLQKTSTERESSFFQSKPSKNKCFFSYSQPLPCRCCALRLSSFSMNALLLFGQLRGYFTLELMISSQMLKGSSEDSPKGSLPQMSSQVMTPSDQRSTWKLQPLPVTISGAMQWGVPMMVLVLNLRSILSFLAVPMSTRVRKPLTFIMRFSGLRSRQMMRLEWRCSIIRRIWAANWRACQGVNETTLVMTSKRSSPSMNSMMKQMKLESFISLWNPTTKGNLGTVLRIYSSFIMYWIICDFYTYARSSTFIAYVFSVLVFQHAYTFPKFPSRSLRITWKSLICIFFSNALRSSPSPPFTRRARGVGATSNSQSNLPIIPSSDATISYLIFTCFLSSNSAASTTPLGEKTTLCPLSSVFSSTQMQPLCSLPFLNTTSPFLKFRKSQSSLAYFSFLASKASKSGDSLIIFHTTFLFITFLRLSPRLLLTFQRLIEITMHLVLARRVLVLTPPSTSIEFSPKQSISLSQWFFSLMSTVPCLMTQKELASSPWLKMTCPSSQVSVKQVEASAFFCSSVSSLKKVSTSRNFLFSFSCCWLMSSITCLKTFRFISTSSQSVSANTEAERGALQIMPRSPKESPQFSVLFFSPLISTWQAPSSRMQQDPLLSPCLKMQLFLSAEQGFISLVKNSISLSFSCEKMKCFFSAFLISAMSASSITPHPLYSTLSCIITVSSRTISAFFPLRFYTDYFYIIHNSTSLLRSAPFSRKVAVLSSCSSLLCSYSKFLVALHWQFPIFYFRNNQLRNNPNPTLVPGRLSGFSPNNWGVQSNVIVVFLFIILFYEKQSFPQSNGHCLSCWSRNFRALQVGSISLVFECELERTFFTWMWQAMAT